MRNLFVTVFLFVSAVLLAQNSDDVSKKKFDYDFLFGVNLQTTSYTINDKLKAASLPEIKETLPEFVLGVNVFWEKFSADAEFGTVYGKNDNSTYNNQYVGFTFRLRGHYNLINKENIAFTGGLSLSGTSSELDVFTKSNAIDLNNLATLNSNHISLRNDLFYIGPSASLYLFKNKKHVKVKANLGYEFAFTNGKWRSDFATINNTVNESGNNRFIFGITLL